MPNASTIPVSDPLPTITVYALPELKDNYVWVLVDKLRKEAIVIDPSAESAVIELLNTLNVALKAILITHHHWDHTDGIAGLLQHWPEVKVFCSKYDFMMERVPGATQAVSQGENISVLGMAIAVIEVPGHTLGAVAYYFADLPDKEEKPAVFVGDTLFLGGCGRLFEGTASQMWESLQKIMALPLNTHIYCAHEYTENNYSFALQEFPNHQAIQNRLAVVQQQRALGEITVPVTLDTEKQTNPFLLSDDHKVMALLGATTPLEAFTELRQRRDRY